MATQTSKLKLIKPALTEAADIAVINGNMDKIDAAMATHGQPGNMLINSNFRNPVNQRKIADGSTIGANQYCYDMWKCATAGLNVSWYQQSGLNIENYVSSAGRLVQVVERCAELRYRPATIAVMWDNTIYAASVPNASWDTTSSGASDQVVCQCSTVSGGSISLHYDKASGLNTFVIQFAAGQDAQIRWVALYEGAYTAETLPVYHRKTYQEELLDCQRYFLALDKTFFTEGAGHANSASEVRLTLPTATTMRTNPTVILEGGGPGDIWCRGAGHSLQASAVACTVSAGRLNLSVTVSGATTNHAYSFRYEKPLYFSAEY